jgi:hypothetical protein
MEPGVVGVDLIDKVFAVLEPQALFAVTLIVPDVNGVGRVTLMEVVPCPLLITEPAGADQVYELLFAIAVHE